jgi:hypothetical protein
LAPLFRNVLNVKTWTTREKSLARAYSLLAATHNDLKITEPLSTKTSHYYKRPYSVIFAERFAKAIKQAIRDPNIKKIRTDIGSIDQFTDSTDVVVNLDLLKKLRVVYK